MRKRPIFCGWCGYDVGTGHSKDCLTVTESRLVWEHEPEAEPQPCGHPTACSDEGTCGWCAEVARLREVVNAADRKERQALADLDEREANVARLREALEAWVRFMGQPPIDKHSYDSQWEDAWKLTQAAIREADDDARGMETETSS